MKMIEIKGFSGLMMLLFGTLMTVLLIVALPAAFMMTLWNAIIFEGFNGPEISLLQGLLLWLAALISFKLIANPEIVVEFQKMDDSGKNNNKPSDSSQENHR